MLRRILRCLLLSSLPLLVYPTAITTINILSFSPSHTNYHPWKVQNDPVMGGKSSSSFSNNENYGHFTGVVRDVPKLNAPGFIKIQTSSSDRFPNISTCSHLFLEAKSETNSEYKGWRLGIGYSRPSNGRRHAFGHKTTFKAPSVYGYSNVSMALNTFTNYWDPATGDPIVSCKEDTQYCPTFAVLSSIQTISIWAEGVNGKVDLKLRNIYASGCNGVVDPIVLAGGISNIEKSGGTILNGFPKCSGILSVASMRVLFFAFCMLILI